MNQENNNIENLELSDLYENDVPSFSKKSDKYLDLKSSANTMLIVGIIGIILLTLVLLDVIPIPINPDTAWLFTIVLSIVFIIFIITGIISMKNAKALKVEAEAEDLLIEEILNFGKNNIFAEDIDKDLNLSEPVEILYFNRADKIKNQLMHQYENADESLIQEMVEQVYQELYEKENVD